MSVAALRPHGSTGLTLLVEHWFALGLSRKRQPARLRLEETLGHDFAHSLVFALTRSRED